MAEKLNKLQIRAKVFDVIKSYTSEDDFEKDIHKTNIKKLNEIEDKSFVCEILLKELTSTSDFELKTIKYILADFATLDIVEDSIWALLQNPDISDKNKEIYLQLLRALGGKVDINLLMDCMNDFENVVDEQTQSLLEVATVNPEAQIDFLDFITTLKSTEQNMLISSLAEDFKGDELANILSPALRISLNNEVKKNIINILSSSKSYLAIKPLKNFLSANTDKELKKEALIALNQLKSDGIDINNEEIINVRENEICSASSFYKAFLSQVDGCANQGLIFSRITPDNKITMFSTVINTKDGIMDCFGLRDISENDFSKVITRFKNNDLVVPLSAGAAKYILSRAEKLSNSSKANIPYEYLCWSVYTCDIKDELINYDALLTEKIVNFTNDIYKKLYDSETFDTWFFEYDDNRKTQEFLDLLIDNSDKDINDLFNLLENEIETIYSNIFDEEKISEYSQMLSDAAYIFYLNKDFERANISQNLAASLDKQDRFLKDIIRRSALQYLANIVAQSKEEKSDNIFLSDNKVNISLEKAFELLNKLEEKWDNMYE